MEHSSRVSASAGTKQVKKGIAESSVAKQIDDSISTRWLKIKLNASWTEPGNRCPKSHSTSEPLVLPFGRRALAHGIELKELREQGMILAKKVSCSQ